MIRIVKSGSADVDGESDGYGDAGLPVQEYGVWVCNDGDCSIRTKDGIHRYIEYLK